MIKCYSFVINELPRGHKDKQSFENSKNLLNSEDFWKILKKHKILKNVEIL